MKNSQFLGLAETRVAHLRQLSHHMRALEWDSASLADVEREVPELDSAMAVFRRLHSVPTATAGVADAAGTAAPAPTEAEPKPAAKPRPAARRSTARRGASRRRSGEANPPSFKEFALKHLDALTQDASSPDAAAKLQRVPNGTRRQGNGATTR